MGVVSAHTETAFETAIEQGLVAMDGYQKRKPVDYDEALALFPDDVIGFIQDSQPKRWT
jgi:type I restriction enzyme R subunit